MYRCTLFLCFVALLGLGKTWGQCAQITGFNTGGLSAVCPGETILLNVIHNDLSHFGIVYTVGAPTNHGPVVLYDVSNYGANNIFPVVLNKLTAGSGIVQTTTFNWDIPEDVVGTISVYAIFGSSENDYPNATTTCASKSYFKRNLSVNTLDTTMTLIVSPSCPGMSSTAQLQNIEGGVNYYVVQLSSYVQVGGPVNGSAGSDVNIVFPTPVNPKNYAILAESVNNTCTDTFGFFTFFPLAVPPTNLMVSDPTVCDGANATVSVSNPASGVTYSLYRPNGNVQGIFNASGVINFLPPATGNYTVRAVDDTSGCQSNTFPDAAMVNFFPNPSASISGQGLYCNGSSPNPIHFQLTSGITPWTFVYELDDGITQSLDTINNALGQQSSLTNPDAGCYRLIEILADGNGCSDNSPGATQCVVVLDPLNLTSLTVSDIEVCADQPIFLTATLANPVPEEVEVSVGTKTITIAQGNSSGSTDPFIPNNFGTLNYNTSNTQYVLAPQCSVTTLRTATLTRKEIITPPTFENPDQLILCEGGNTFDLLIKTPDLMGDPNVDLILDTPDGLLTETLVANGSTQSIAVNIPPPGNHTYEFSSIRYTSGESCSPGSIDGELALIVLSDLHDDLSLGLDNTCEGTKIPYLLTKPAGAFKVKVLVDNNSGILGSQSYTLLATETELMGNLSLSQSLPEGSYQFWIDEASYHSNGQDYCLVNGLDTSTVKIMDQPQASFTFSDSTPCVHTAVQFHNSTLNDSFYSFVWDFGDDSTSTATNPIHFFRSIDDFTVKLTAWTGNCQDDESTHVSIASGPEPVDIYQLRKEGQDDVVLVAYDDNNRNGHILEYRWRHLSTGLDSVWGKNNTLYLANIDDAPGMWVETRFDNGGNCFAASTILSKRLPLPSLEPALLIFPNPSRGVFQVRISGVFHGKGILRIMDLTGRRVSVQHLEKMDSQMDLKFTGDLAPGQYIIHYSIPDQASVHGRLTIH